MNFLAPALEIISKVWEWINKRNEQNNAPDMKINKEAIEDAKLKEKFEDMVKKGDIDSIRRAGG